MCLLCDAWRFHPKQMKIQSRVNKYSLRFHSEQPTAGNNLNAQPQVSIHSQTSVVYAYNDHCHQQKRINCWFTHEHASVKQTPCWAQRTDSGERTLCVSVDAKLDNSHRKAWLSRRGRGAALTTKEHKGTFCGTGNVPNLDWGGRYIGYTFLKLIKIHTWNLYILLFVNSISIELLTFKIFLHSAAVIQGWLFWSGTIFIYGDISALWTQPNCMWLPVPGN